MPILYGWFQVGLNPAVVAFGAAGDVNLVGLDMASYM